MLWLDLKHAVEGGADNFTCLLMGLMMKSDVTNSAKLAKEYPIEAQMVWLFKNDCSYKDDNHMDVDWELIELRAREIERLS